MAKKQSKTEVSLFDFYESTTEGVFDKSYHPYKAFPIKKIKAFKLPKSNFKKIPEGYFFADAPEKVPSFVPPDASIDNALFKCKKLNFVPAPNSYLQNNDPHNPERYPAAISKDNKFLFTVWTLDDNWNMVRVTNSHTHINIPVDIPIPRWWYAPAFRFGFVSMCTEQQDFFPLPPQYGMGAGIPFNRYVNVLLQREVQNQRMEYAILKIGVNNSDQHTTFLPYFAWGFEQLLVSGTGDLVLKLYDIESQPGMMYAVGHVKKKNGGEAVRLFRLKDRIVQDSVDVLTLSGKVGQQYAKVSIDHAYYNKSGKTRITVLVNSRVYVVDANEQSMTLASGFDLVSANTSQQEWTDIAANCGQVLIQRNGQTESAAYNADKEDITMFNYTTGAFQSSLYGKKPKQKVHIEGMAISNPNGILSNNPPLTGIFTGSIVSTSIKSIFLFNMA